MDIILDKITDFNSLEEAASKLALKIMKKYIEELEEEFFKNKAEDIEVVGFRKRTIATKQGEIILRRRLYRKKDSKDDYIFLLDRKLNIGKGKTVSEDYLKLLVTLSSMLASGR